MRTWTLSLVTALLAAGCGGGDTASAPPSPTDSDPVATSDDPSATDPADPAASDPGAGDPADGTAGDPADPADPGTDPPPTDASDPADPPPASGDGAATSSGIPGHNPDPDAPQPDDNLNAGIGVDYGAGGFHTLDHNHPLAILQGSFEDIDAAALAAATYDKQIVATTPGSIFAVRGYDANGRLLGHAKVLIDETGEGVAGAYRAEWFPSGGGETASFAGDLGGMMFLNIEDGAVTEEENRTAHAELEWIGASDPPEDAGVQPDNIEGGTPPDHSGGVPDSEDPIEGLTPDGEVPPEPAAPEGASPDPG